MKKNVFGIIFGMVFMMMGIYSCSSNESVDDLLTRSTQENAESGYTWGTWIGKNIPVDLVPISELPDWIRPSIEKGKEVEMMISNYKIFEGKWKGEKVYYINNDFSSCIGCLYYHQDGRQFEPDDWGEDGISYADFSDWRCIWSAAPLIKGMTGILRYDPTEDRSSYVDNGGERYYIWGNMNTSELQPYDGKRVVMSGFSHGDITFVVKDCPSGTACYGIEATYLSFIEQ